MHSSPRQSLAPCAGPSTTILRVNSHLRFWLGTATSVSSTEGTRTVTCAPPRIHGPFGFSLPGGTIFVPTRNYAASTLPSGFDVVAPGT